MSEVNNCCVEFLCRVISFGSCDSQTLTGTRFNHAIGGQNKLIFWVIVSVVIDAVSDYPLTGLFLFTLVSLNCMILVACGFDSLLSQT